MLRNSLESKEAPNLGHSNMPIEPLRCKVCGGLLDDRLKCQHCGTLHERVENRLEIIKICLKHLIGYSVSECPKCIEEQQALILYNQEQARLSAEKEGALRKEREAFEKEKLRRIEQARLEHEQWKKSAYPKLKKLSVVALLCLIIGVAGICLSTENYISHNVNVVSHTSTSYELPFPSPTPTSVAPTSPITVISNNGFYDFNLWDGELSGIDVSAQHLLFSVSVYLNNGEASNFLWTDDFGGLGLPNGIDVISFSKSVSGDTYFISATYATEYDGSESGVTLNATIMINYIPTATQLNELVNGMPTPQPTSQPTGKYVTHTTILNETYSFNQGMSKISTSTIGITEILLIVIGALILVAIPIVVYSKSCYELEQAP